MTPTPTLALRTSALIGALLLATPARAQLSEQVLAEGAEPSAQDGFFLGEVDGALWGLGNDYKARFEPGSVELTPALGADAPRNLPVRLTLESVRSGDEVIWTPPQPSLPLVQGGFEDGAAASAVAVRGDGVVEHYEVTPGGLSYSLELPSSLASASDLRVRLRATTELAKRSAASGYELSFGERTAASLRSTHTDLTWSGDVLELAPLGSSASGVGTPILGLTLQVSVVDNASDPDVAYDASFGRYLYVWTEQFSGLDFDLRGRFQAGATLSTLFVPIETDDSMIAVAPSVGSVNATDTFLVSWTQSQALFAPTDVAARSVAAGSFFPTVSPILIVAGDAGAEFAPDVASESSAGSPFLLMVYDDDTTLEIARVLVPAAPATPSVDFVGLVSANVDSTLDRPCISKAGGPSGRHLVTWQRLMTAATHDIFVRVFDRNGIALTSEVNMTSSPTEDDTRADVDGNGSEFVVVYDRDGSPTLVHDVVAQVVTWNGFFLTFGASNTVYGNANQNSMSVTYTGYEYVIANQADGYGVLTMHVLDPFTFHEAQTLGFVADGGFDGHPDLVSTYSATAVPSDDGRMVHSDLTTTNDVLMSVLQGNVGRQEVFSGCGNGGQFTAGIPDQGSELTLALEGAPGLHLYVLALGLGELGLACGSCEIVPDLTLPAVTGFTTSTGNASVVVDVPSNPALNGLDFFAQWLVFDTLAECPLFGVDASNALHFRLL